MEVAGERIPVLYLGGNLKGQAEEGNLEAVDAILDNLSQGQAETLEDSIARLEVQYDLNIGTDSNDFIFEHGTEGSEAIFGLDGNDRIYGGSGDSQLFGGEGNDILYDFRGGEDVIHGGEGNDRLYGGAGDNVLYGGSGSDLLRGGKGADTFVFEKGEEGRDLISSFNERNDSIDISSYLEEFDPTQDAINDFVFLSGGNHKVLFVDADGADGPQDAVQIALFLGEPNLTVDDLNLVDVDLV
jgi:Ca2+-binding RTX toxin-like protein